MVATLGAAITANFIMDGFTVRDGVSVPATDITVNGIQLRERFGAGWNNTSGSPTLRNMIFENNAITGGTGFGIAFYNSGGNPTVSNTIFRNNNGPDSRGGAWFNTSGNPVLNNVAMHGNNANIGGAWCQDNGNPVLNNVTIAGNKAFTGGGIYTMNGNIALNNSIVFHNTATDGAGIKLLEMPPTFAPTVGYNHCMAQNLAGGSNGNLNGNTQSPGFVNPVAGTSAPTTTGDYHLSSTSPCINEGSNTAIASGVLTDLEGHIRIANTTVDMGAYEFGSTPLGVDISNFSARSTACSVQLSWKGSHETKLSRYEIEAARQAMHFVPAGKVMALNQSSAAYTFDLEQTEAIMYYRIKAVDLDGSYKYSSVLTASVNCANKFPITCAPNPAKEILSVSGLQQGQVVRIIDLRGRMVWQQEVNNSLMEIPVQQYAHGLYQVAVFSNRGLLIRSEKVAIQ